MTALPVLHTYNMDFFRIESIKGPVNIPNVNGTSSIKEITPTNILLPVKSSTRSGSAMSQTPSAAEENTCADQSF
ncbi:hypothetical protein NL474_29685, partial [Klebsiella pneumoniae]|nr:hypothetical protein [Klebsiella pneumoniae]